jgi:vacuolar-type H+-ATPase subunit F/Vma7
MSKIAFVTPKDADHGFKLAGAFQFVALSSNVIEIVRSLLNQGEFGIILIDERLLDEQTMEEINQLQSRFDGIISILPSPYKEGEVSYDIVDMLISRAIGYQVRFKK